MKSPAPFPSSKLQKPGGEVPTLAAVCLADVPKLGGMGRGCLAEQPPGWLSQSNTVPLPRGWQDRGEGWGGPGGSPCTAVYIQGCSLSGTRCGHLCVCEPPLPHALHDL